MRLFGIQTSQNFTSFNADVKSPSLGPSVADIRSAEVQESAPARYERTVDVSSSEKQDDAKEEEEQAA